MEYTYIMIKPDGDRENIFNHIMERIKEEGFGIVAIDKAQLGPDTIKEHYEHLLDKPFYPELEEFMMSGYVFPIIVKGDNAVDRMREIMGATDPKQADKGTIREIFGNKEIMTYNVIHGSDSIENAFVEIERFFNYKKNELDKLEIIPFEDIKYYHY